DNSSLSQASRLDPVTGLLSARGLEEHLGLASAQTRHRKWKTLFMLVALDDFKNINDLLGNAAGDLLLQQAASRLRSLLRGTDQAGRLSGGNFVLLLPDVSEEKGLEIADRIRKAVASEP